MTPTEHLLAQIAPLTHGDKREQSDTQVSLRKNMTTGQGIGRQDVVEYLRWLADAPDGICHREWLFHAALLIQRDAETIFIPMQKRHGDHTT